MYVAPGLAQGDALGLFGGGNGAAAAATQAGGQDGRRPRNDGKDDATPSEKHTKLFPNDTVASVFLNLYGSNGFATLAEPVVGFT